MENRASLKAMITGKDLVMAPGAYDALTAKIVETAGFKAVYMTGYGTSAGRFGLPDLGLLTMTEMVENAARIAEAVRIPLIADADTGYGNPINVVRTVKAYERAGAAAIHLEDQVWPKRCGHMRGKRVIEARDMVEKIRAAVDARENPEFLVIARTDAIATHGFDAAIERGAMYAEAGADILFIEAPVNREQMAAIPRRLPSTPHLVNMAPLTPNLSARELHEMGYRLAIYPGICLAATISACRTELTRLMDTGIQRNLEEWIQSFVDLNNFLGADHFARLEEKYRVDPAKP
jgi:2-methylisocitrate lyase-like PEP mutase family enzyme